MQPLNRSDEPPATPSELIVRALFLVLLLANLLVFAAQFDVVRNLVFFWDAPAAPRPAQLNAERLRIIRDTSTLPRAPANSSSTGASPG
jgi:hypothetical protein